MKVFPFGALALLLWLWSTPASAQSPVLVGTKVPLDAKCIEASLGRTDRIFVTGAPSGREEVNVKAFPFDARGESIRSQALLALYQVVETGPMGSVFYWACFRGKRVAGLTIDASGAHVH
jgi:hypothetical protein